MSSLGNIVNVIITLCGKVTYCADHFLGTKVSSQCVVHLKVT